jgi:hypothetical protein
VHPTDAPAPEDSPHGSDDAAALSFAPLASTSLDNPDPIAFPEELQTMRFRNQRDLWSGIMFIVTGLLFIALSGQYQMGTAAKMGPGYFPTMLGAFMAILGLIVAIGSMAKSNPETRLTPVGWRELLLVLAAVLAFAFLLPKLGVVLSIVVLILTRPVASHEFKLRDTILSIVVLLILSYVGVRSRAWNCLPGVARVPHRNNPRKTEGNPMDALLSNPGPGLRDSRDARQHVLLLRRCPARAP